MKFHTPLEQNPIIKMGDILIEQNQIVLYFKNSCLYYNQSRSKVEFGTLCAGESLWCSQLFLFRKSSHTTEETDK